MDKFKNFMSKRYGVDQLSIILLILSLILISLSRIRNLQVLALISFVPIIIFFFRVLSGNIPKRYQENNKLMNSWNRLKFWYDKKIKRIQDSKTHKYYKCPSCSQTLRVPKGKGKITITCPKCKTQFTKKT